MMKFAVATKPEPVKDNLLLILSYIIGFGTAGIAVAQMVSFDNFVNALRSYGIFGYRGTLALAIVVLVFEVFSVPFWLRLSLSKAARLVSALYAVLVPLIWTVMTVIAMMNGHHVSDAGYFGGHIRLQVSGFVLVLDLVWLVVVSASFNGLGGRKAFKL
jgi:hypothetical protein